MKCYSDIDTQIDVDTQIDFMNKDGALYVPGAEKIKPNLSMLTEYALKNGVPILSTADCHLPSDSELIKNGGQFPDHCMRGTYGAIRIPETRVPNPLIFYKRCTDIFDLKLGSKQFSTYLKKTNVTTAIVYGVVLDICVQAVITGLLERNIETYLVTDATIHLDEENGRKALNSMISNGLKLTTVKEIL